MATVLLIEDDPDIRENTCELLELEGFNVIFTGDGKTGVAMALEKKPDVIICDIKLPGADGYEIFDVLKYNTDTASIPFIFVSASVEKKGIQRALQMGAYGYIQKPYEPKILFDLMAKCLGSRGYIL